MRALAAKSKVATQMGNQGHCEEGYRRLCEYGWCDRQGDGNPQLDEPRQRRRGAASTETAGPGWTSLGRVDRARAVS